MGERVAAIVEYRVRESMDGEFTRTIRGKWAFQERSGYIEPGGRLARVDDQQHRYVEVFTWIDAHAISRAHGDAEMDAIWDALDHMTVGGRSEGIRIQNGPWV